MCPAMVGVHGGCGGWRDGLHGMRVVLGVIHAHTSSTGWMCAKQLQCSKDHTRYHTTDCDTTNTMRISTRARASDAMSYLNAHLGEVVAELAGEDGVY